MLRNVVSNYATAIWMGALSLVTIPIYVRLLGANQWGIVAGCMTLQGFLTFLDAGCGQIMPRSFARIAGDRAKEAHLFAVYARIYLVLGAFGFLGGQLLARTVARHWFHAPDMEVGKLEWALRLVLVQFLFQFANNAHLGFWNGMQYQGEANLRQVVFTTARHAGALSIVFLGVRNAFGYLVPFVICAVVECLLNRRAVLARLSGAVTVRPNVCGADVRRIIRDASGLTLGILIGVLVSQVDRLVLSATQDLSQYGPYVIVANLGMAFLNLQYPLMRAFFPRIVREATLNGSGRGQSFRRLLGAVAVLCVIPSLILSVFAQDLLMAWLKKPEIVRVGTLPLRLILGAVALNSIYNVIYQRIVSAGRSKVVIAINLGGLTAAALAIGLCGTGIGITLGGVIWLSSQTTQLALGVIWLVSQADRPRDERRDERQVGGAEEPGTAATCVVD